MMPRYHLADCLIFIGLLLASVFGSTGCERMQQSVRRFSVGDEYTVRDILSDNDGAWVSMDRSSDYAQSFETVCLFRRYRTDGSVEREVMIGSGLCRRLISTRRGYLALIVRRIRDGLAVDLWTSDKTGTSWKNSGQLPCEALGVLRLFDGSILIWNEVRLFKSVDEGGTWVPVPVTFPGPEEKHLSRCGIIELGEAKILFGVDYYGGPGKSSTRFGQFSGERFQSSIAVPGRLIAAGQRADGSVILLCHDENSGESSQVLYEMENPTSKTPSLRAIDRESSMIPMAMISTKSGVVVLSAKNKIPFFFFSSFKKKVFSETKTASGKWETNNVKVFEGLQPQILSISPNGDVWMYLSSLSEHCVVQVKTPRHGS